MNYQNMPNKIKVRIYENSMGHITLYPISSEASRFFQSLLASGQPSIYLQAQDDIESFLVDFPRSIYRKHGFNGVEVNDGAVILVDSDWFLSYLMHQNINHLSDIGNDLHSLVSRA